MHSVLSEYAIRTACFYLGIFKKKYQSFAMSKQGLGDFGARCELAARTIREARTRAELARLQPQVQELRDAVALAKDLPSYTQKHLQQELQQLDKLLAAKSKEIKPKFSFRGQLASPKSEKSPQKVSTNPKEDLVASLQTRYSDVTAKTIEIKCPTKPIVMKNLKQCRVNVAELQFQVHLEECVDCEVSIETSGPVMCHDCESLNISGTCHQLRLHNVRTSSVRMDVASKEVLLEGCRDVGIGQSGVKVSDFDLPTGESQSYYWI